VTRSPESLTKVKSGAGSPSRTGKSSSSRHAVGVVRVSRVGTREGERFVSPREQRQRISDACERDGLELVDVVQELDVSGGTSLDQRPGLRQAVEMIEAGEAKVLVVAYFDRLVRSLQVQQDVLERVERAGGGVVALDVGEVRADTASRWLSSTMLGMVAEYHRRVTAERTQDAKRRAVARGVPPFALIPPGYRRTAEGRLEPHPREARVVADAFRRRAGGATVMEVRAYLREHGIERSFHGTVTLLQSRIVLGELHFGDLVNTASHPAIVDARTWQAVQGMRSPRGRRPKSERLLARLGILRCGTCGARMVIGSTKQGEHTYSFYRCPPVGDCPERVTISSDAAEKTVVAAVQDAVAGIRGTASVADGLSAAEDDVEAAEKELEAAVLAFSGLDDVEAARQRLTDLQVRRDAARGRLADLQAAATPAVTVAAGDWDRLSVDERRALIRAVVLRADVRPGRGGDRVTVQLRGE
jgi:site-specific DNA recombinase